MLSLIDLGNSTLRFTFGKIVTDDVTGVLREQLRFDSLPDDALRAAAQEALNGSVPRPDFAGRPLSARVRVVLASPLGIPPPDAATVRNVALGVEAFARAPADLEPGARLYPEQIRGAMALTQRALVQMDTGEGKTYALLPAAFALACKHGRVFVVCANEYLAWRDATRTRPYWELLGIEPGLALHRLAKEAEWQSPVVYTTLDAMIFKTLDDEVSPSGAGAAFAHKAVLLDEADAILLDNPHGGFQSVLGVRSASFDWHFALDFAQRLEEERQVSVNRATMTATLTLEGEAELRRALEAYGRTPGGYFLARFTVEMAFVAMRVAKEDRDYVVEEDGIAAVDRVTGKVERARVMPWILPLEFHRGFPPRPRSLVVNRTTPRLFLQAFAHVAGLSGTLKDDSLEYLVSYRLPTLVVPPRLSRRGTVEPLVARRTRAAAMEALVEEVRGIVAGGRPVLVGTGTIDDAEAAREALRAGLPPQTRLRLVTGLSDREAAEAFARAGEAGSVVVATQLGGRGVDIRLTPESRANGGLHLVSLGHAPERRHDRQFLGRAGRQGDPYTARFICSFDDPLFELANRQLLNRLVDGVGVGDDDLGPSLAFTVRQTQHNWQKQCFLERRTQEMFDLADGDIRRAAMEWFEYLRIPPDAAESERGGEGALSGGFLEWVVGRYVDAALRPLLGDDRPVTPAGAASVVATLRETLDLARGDEPVVALDLEGRPARVALQLCADRLRRRAGLALDRAADERRARSGAAVRADGWGLVTFVLLFWLPPSDWLADAAPSAPGEEAPGEGVGPDGSRPLLALPPGPAADADGPPVEGLPLSAAPPPPAAAEDAASTLPAPGGASASGAPPPGSPAGDPLPSPGEAEGGGGMSLLPWLPGARAELAAGGGEAPGQGRPARRTPDPGVYEALLRKLEEGPGDLEAVNDVLDAAREAGMPDPQAPAAVRAAFHDLVGAIRARAEEEGARAMDEAAPQRVRLRLLELRAPRQTAHARLQLGWAEFLEARERIRDLARQRSYRPLDYFRVVSDELAACWLKAEAAMPGEVLRDLLRCDRPETLDDLFFPWDQREDAPAPELPAYEWTPAEAPAGSPAPPSDARERLIERFFQRHALELADPHAAGEVRGTLARFLENAPLRTLGTPARIQRAVDDFFAEVARMGVERRRMRSDRKWVRRFLAFLREQDLVGPLPTLRTFTRSTLARLVRTLREPRTVLPLSALAAFAAVFAAATLWGPPMLPRHPTGLWAAAESVVFGGMLAAGAVTAGCFAIPLVVHLVATALGFVRPYGHLFPGILARVCAVALAAWVTPWSWHAFPAALLDFLVALVVLELATRTVWEMEYRTGVDLVEGWLCFTIAAVFLPRLVVETGSRAPAAAVAAIAAASAAWRRLNAADLCLGSSRITGFTSSAVAAEAVESTVEVAGSAGVPPHVFALACAWMVYDIERILPGAGGARAVSALTLAYLAVIAYATAATVAGRLSLSAWTARLSAARQAFIPAGRGADLAGTLATLRWRLTLQETAFQATVFVAAAVVTRGEVVPGTSFPLTPVAVVAGMVLGRVAEDFALQVHHFLLGRVPYRVTELDLRPVHEAEEEGGGWPERVRHALEGRVLPRLMAVIFLLEVVEKLVKLAHQAAHLAH
ncbi:MAG: hypothetical protein ACJ8J0_19845 [Longimicrobiaceae bacterium]